MGRVKKGNVGPAELVGATEETNKRSDTSPDWHYWQQMPHDLLWKLVALSCDIEPRRVRLADTNYWIDRARWGEAEHRDRDKEFSDRLEIASARIGELHHASVNMGDGNEPRIKLAEFAAWTLLMRWKTPQQLVDMAKAVTKQSKTVSKSEILSTTERGTVQKLIAGFLAQGYSRDRISKPYAIAKEVQLALQSAGLNLSDDTIVTWVKDAASLLTPSEKNLKESK